MAHINRLTAIRVQKLKAPGMHPDGAGLYLQVTGDGRGKSWIFRYSLRGRAREMGLGAIAKVTLAEARSKAAEYHKLIDSGIDPILWREQQRAQAALAQTGSITFSEAARQHIASHSQGFRNAKFARQYGETIRVYAEPILGKLLVRDIDTALVMRVLEPIWTTKTETASKVRGRIERILNWAKVQGYRSGENPAHWKGHLDHLLPAPRQDQSKQSPCRAAVHRDSKLHAGIETATQHRRSCSGIFNSDRGTKRRSPESAERGDQSRNGRMDDSGRAYQNQHCAPHSAVPPRTRARHRGRQ
jgi:hypothetical protein